METVVEQKELYGVAASFDSPEELLAAAKEVRKSGYTKVEAFTPFPIHGIDDVLGTPHSKLGYIVICCGLIGAISALSLIYWTGAIDYPLIVGGKPMFAFEPSIPITFELTVLLSAFGAVFGMLALNGLPLLYHPIFNFRNAHRITDDQFVLLIEKADPKFDALECSRLLRGMNPSLVDMVEE
ncbi:MAG: DUF3341 domain-containing protein [Bryobacteraceae bacterium]|jgi:hypothetical protein|nr:DUF3341 domain-containing protein [Bryobacteraceae bacterium]